MNFAVYEINTRVWIKKFAQNNNNPKLLDVPNNYWKSLVEKGIKYIWLMGIWKIVPEIIQKACFVDGLIHEYNLALPDWKPEDIIGSPYSIDNYIINESLASTNEFIQFKENLNKLGLKIILDFIPNHFNAESSLINTNPQIFLEGDEYLLSSDKRTYFKAINGKIYAHGKDPYFQAWQDTIQVNYFSQIAQQFMIDSLINITKLCDGVRCDMAMLPMRNVFQNTWSAHTSLSNIDKIEAEFWHNAIANTKKVKPDFLFIAEAYWDLEWQLQQIGFDFTYDKKMLDRLEFSNAEHVAGHLRAEQSFQNKSLRFIENHDENRAIIAFGIEKSKAAAVVVTTIQGNTLFYDGQFEGKTIRLPLQLGREPIEVVNNSLVKFYDKLLQITKHPVFIYGEWSLLDTIQLHRDFTNRNILTWQWNLNNDKRIVVVNFSDSDVYCRIKFDIDTSSDKVILHDLLNNQEYERNVEEILDDGLFIHLGAYMSHIFELK
ncbi:MAG: glycosidase [Bacteroidetes bacterium]|nr:glycosidase [Bacteroidota bacterium]MBU1116328.1 glycosidase [Bacteroidota bacterium]MBU1796901.1 glycosidase [Bacteroidota bacterium]